jgi:hypothetical protein
MCGKKLGEVRIELKQDMIDKAELEELDPPAVEDPSCLRFCGKRCQGRWWAIRRGTVWNQHGKECMCAACFR